MADPARRAKLVRDLEQDFVPDYDAQNMPSGDKRAAYALEHIAFRVGRIEQSLARIAAVIESALTLVEPIRSRPRHLVADVLVTTSWNGL